MSPDPSPPAPVAFSPDAALLVAGLVFATGIGFACLLGWLAARSFALLRDPATTPAQPGALRDLPLALPEGTVRAVLALLVGVVGLPLLLFSQALGLRDAVIGYVNGIIAGVFGYYFGARGTAPDARRLGAALDDAQQQNATLRGNAEAAERRAASAADAASLPGRAAAALRSLDRQLGLAGIIVDTLGPALPPGLLPADAAATLQRLRGVAQSARDLAGGAVDEATLKRLIDAMGRLAGGTGPLASLLRQAAGALPALAGGPLGAIAAALGLGAALGSAAYRRWRAQILAAPHDPQLFDAGLITPGAAELALQAAPGFSHAFAARAAEPGFLATLLDQALRPDGAALLWAAHGHDAPGIESEAAMAAALAEFRHALLADRLAADITPAMAQQVAQSLSPANAALRPQALDAAALQALLRAPPSGLAPQRAALEASVLLLDAARAQHIDLPAAMAELAP